MPSVARMIGNRGKLFRFFLLPEFRLEQSLIVGHYRKASIWVNDAITIGAGFSDQICIAPKIAQLHPLPANDEEAGLRTDCRPSLPWVPITLFCAKVRETRVQSLADNLSLPQLYLVHSVRRLWISTVPQVVDHEYPNPTERLEGFACGL